MAVESIMGTFGMLIISTFGFRETRASVSLKAPTAPKKSGPLISNT